MNLNDFLKNHQNRIELLRPEKNGLRAILDKSDDWIERVAKAASELNPKLKIKRDQFVQWLEQQIGKSLDPLHEITHARRVTKLMKLIAKEEGIYHKIPRHTLHIAGLAHDLGRADFISTWRHKILFKAMRDDIHSVNKIKTFFKNKDNGEIPKHIDRAIEAIRGTSVFKFLQKQQAKKDQQELWLGQLISDADNLEMISKARIANGLISRLESGEKKLFIDYSKSMAMKLIVPRMQDSLHFETSKKMYQVMTYESAKFVESVDPANHAQFKKSVSPSLLINAE